MKNPIPRNGLFYTPSMAELQDRLDALPSGERAQAWTLVMMTLNMCHDAVERVMQEKVGE